MAYAPAYPHDPIEEIGTDVFMVRGSIRMNAPMPIPRNLGIVRHRGQRHPGHPIRLHQTGERRPPPHQTAATTRRGVSS